MVICYLGIGSNLGNRKKNIQLAVREIKKIKDTKVIKISKIIETYPAGMPSGQGKFLNTCLKIETNILPVMLLGQLKKIERKLGRPRLHRRWAHRTIDLDILFYGNRVVNRKNLKIPHPKIFAREFVIRPLLEIL